MDWEYTGPKAQLHKKRSPSAKLKCNGPSKKQTTQCIKLNQDKAPAPIVDLDLIDQKIMEIEEILRRLYYARALLLNSRDRNTPSYIT